MKKKVKSLKKLVVILFIILVIILGGIIYIFNSPKMKCLKHLDYINSTKINSGTLSLSDQFYWYSEYIGKLDASVVDKSLYYFSTELLPEYLKATDLSSYYDENAFKIKVDLGIENKEDFSKLVNSLSSLKGSSFELERYSVFKESVSLNKYGIDFVVDIQYKGSDPVLVKLHVSNEMQKSKSSVKYMEETSGKYKAEREDTKIDTSFDTERPGRAL